MSWAQSPLAMDKVRRVSAGGVKGKSPVFKIKPLLHTCEIRVWTLNTHTHQPGHTHAHAKAPPLTEFWKTTEVPVLFVVLELSDSPDYN